MSEEFYFKTETRIVSIEYLINNYIDELSENNLDYELLDYSYYKDDKQILDVPNISIRVEYTKENEDDYWIRRFHQWLRKDGRFL